MLSSPRNNVPATSQKQAINATFTTAASMLRSEMKNASTTSANAALTHPSESTNRDALNKKYTIKPSKKSFRLRTGSAPDIHLIVYPVKAIKGNFTYVWKLKSLNDKAEYKSNWTEKRFVDAVTSSDTQCWARHLCFDDVTLPWFDNNQLVQNDKGYAVRLFIQRLEGEPFAKDILFDIAKDIASCINGMDSVKQKVVVSEESFMASSTRKFVWQEIVGSSQAFIMMKQDIGEPISVDENYYSQNKETIHCYFREKTFNPQLRRVLNAPIDQLHPSFLQTDNQAEAADIAK